MWEVLNYNFSNQTLIKYLPYFLQPISRKKFEQKVRAYKNWIYDNRNRPMREIIKELNVKLIGHYRYYGVTWNFRKITTFLHRVQQFLFKAMNRRGCRRAYTWNGFVEMLKYYPLAKPKTYYCLYWSECYYEEPYAGKPHVRICEGLRLRGLSLLDYRGNPNTDWATESAVTGSNPVAAFSVSWYRNLHLNQEWETFSGGCKNSCVYGK